jgi:hypothetical protein
LHRLAGLWHGRQTLGWIAQSVEQRTENPCVASSILAPATIFAIAGGRLTRAGRRFPVQNNHTHATRALINRNE